MNLRNKEIPWLAAVTLGVGALSGCEYCLYLLPACLAWFVLSRSLPAKLIVQH